MAQQPNEETVIITQTVIKAKCECGRGGQYIATGTVFETYPAQYGHQCDKCSDTKLFWSKYPLVKETTETPSPH